MRQHRETCMLFRIFWWLLNAGRDMYQKNCVTEKEQLFLFQESLIRKEAIWIIQMQIIIIKKICISNLPFTLFMVISRYSGQGFNPILNYWKVNAHSMVVFLCSFILLAFILKAFRLTWEHFFILFFFRLRWWRQQSDWKQISSIRRSVHNVALFINVQNEKYCSFSVCHIKMFRTIYALPLQQPSYLFNQENISVLLW